VLLQVNVLTFVGYYSGIVKVVIGSGSVSVTL
jgi:hypothetical protein